MVGGCKQKPDAKTQEKLKTNTTMHMAAMSTILEGMAPQQPVSAAAEHGTSSEGASTNTNRAPPRVPTSRSASLPRSTSTKTTTTTTTASTSTNTTTFSPTSTAASSITVELSPANVQNNRFASLLDGDNDLTTASSTRHQNSPTCRSSIPSANSMFQQPSFSSSQATYATSLVRANKPQLLTTSLGDLSELTGALDAATNHSDVSEAQRLGNAQRSWDLSNLHSVTTNLVPEEHRHNDFLGRTAAEHQKDIDKLQQGLLQSKRHMKIIKQHEKKKKHQTSRSKNARKNNKKAKGQAHAERMQQKLGKVGKGGGRRKNNRGGRRRQTPY